MNTSCDKCKTAFKIDLNLITSEKKFFKCSVCDYEWSIDTNNFIDHQQNVAKNLDSYKNEERVEQGLEAIRSEVKKNTDKISDEIRYVEKNENNLQTSKKQLEEKKNKVFNVKKKSVADIASEIAEASVKRSASQMKKKKNKIKNKDDDFKNISLIDETPNYKVPLLMLMVIFAVS